MVKLSTPWGAADSVVQIAPGIVEVSTPSHGGILLDPLFKADGTSWSLGAYGECIAVEVNPKLAASLKSVYAVVDVRCGDFLELQEPDLGTFDKVIMNPPFSKAADIAHINHARRLLRPGGRLVAICANGPRQRAALMDEAEHWEDLPAGTFQAQGTGVNAALVVMGAAA